MKSRRFGTQLWPNSRPSLVPPPTPSRTLILTPRDVWWAYLQLRLAQYSTFSMASFRAAYSTAVTAMSAHRARADIATTRRLEAAIVTVMMLAARVEQQGVYPCVNERLTGI